MTRRDAIAMVRRTRAFVDNPANTDRSVRAIVGVQLKALEHQLGQRDAVPIRVVIERVIRKLAAQAEVAAKLGGASRRGL